LAASLIIFGLIWIRKSDSPPGVLFLHFIAFTAGGHLFLEAFRGDGTLVFGGFRLAQIIAWVVLAITFLLNERLKLIAQDG
jgi:hypothetical protein